MEGRTGEDGNQLEIGILDIDTSLVSYIATIILSQLQDTQSPQNTVGEASGVRIAG